MAAQSVFDLGKREELITGGGWALTFSLKFCFFFLLLVAETVWWLGGAWFTQCISCVENSAQRHVNSQVKFFICCGEKNNTQLALYQFKQRIKTLKNEI